MTFTRDKWGGQNRGYSHFISDITETQRGKVTHLSSQCVGTKRGQNKSSEWYCALSLRTLAGTARVAELVRISKQLDPRGLCAHRELPLLVGVGTSHKIPLALTVQSCWEQMVSSGPAFGRSCISNILTLERCTWSVRPEDLCPESCSSEPGPLEEHACL